MQAKVTRLSDKPFLHSIPVRLGPGGLMLHVPGGSRSVVLMDKVSVYKVSRGRLREVRRAKRKRRLK
jgi:hypothetical protein